VIIDKVKLIPIPGPEKSEYRFTISDEDIQYCFALSKMTIIDDNMQETHYFKLKFVEMFECIARLACLGRLEEFDKKNNGTDTTDEAKA
jgi:hypothetical protein